MQDVTFALEAGNGLGVIGPSGSGKSSLVRALVGVWQPFRGKVRLDGAALDQWSPDVLGRHIGYLPQDVELFAGIGGAEYLPLRSRCRAPTPSSPPPRKPACTSMIIKMRDGYDTQIGEQGHRAVGRPGAARGAGAGAVRQSVPDRARRTEFQSRYRGRRGADAGDPRRARARRHRGRGGAPAGRDRGGRPASGAEGRPHAGLRSQGNGARAGAAAGRVAPPVSHAIKIVVQGGSVRELPNHDRQARQAWRDKARRYGCI